MNNTIIAQATPLGVGGIGIIRISGQQVSVIIKKTLLKNKLKPRRATYSCFFDKNKKMIDYGISIWFPKPKSFTGEDVLEFHCHGGQTIINMLMKSVLEIPNIRLANPGEFSKRAFLNKKIDLIQAEAIMDLINAESEQEAFYALNSLKGKFSKIINILSKSIIEIRTYVEANIDFSEEEITFLSKTEIDDKLKGILEKINFLIVESKKIYKLNKGIKVVIAGNTNVGKSSLLNLLTNKKSSIVTNLEGTTRDIITKSININGIKMKISDTAGLRKTDNIIEKIGIEFSWKEIKKADHVLYVIDVTKLEKKTIEYFINEANKIIKKMKKNSLITFIINKIDLTNNKTPTLKEIQNHTLIYISANNNIGIDILKNHLVNSFNKININLNKKMNFAIRHRHIEKLKESYKCITKCLNFHHSFHIELIAEELKLAQQYLENIVGRFTSDNLLEKIFSNFCIGK